MISCLCAWASTFLTGVGTGLPLMLKVALDISEHHRAPKIHMAASNDIARGRYVTGAAVRHSTHNTAVALRPEEASKRESDILYMSHAGRTGKRTPFGPRPFRCQCMPSLGNCRLWPWPRFSIPHFPLVNCSSAVKSPSSNLAHTPSILARRSSAVSRLPLLFFVRSPVKHLLTARLMSLQPPVALWRKPRAWHSSRAFMISSHPAENQRRFVRRLSEAMDIACFGKISKAQGNRKSDKHSRFSSRPSDLRRALATYRDCLVYVDGNAFLRIPFSSTNHAVQATPTSVGRRTKLNVEAVVVVEKRDADGLTVTA